MVHGGVIMAQRQVKLQEFLTHSQVEANVSNEDVSSKLEKAGASKLTAVIVELETATYKRCCLCHRKRMLRFCLEYLNDEGAIALWGEICEECADKTTALNNQEVQFS